LIKVLKGLERKRGKNGRGMIWKGEKKEEWDKFDG